MLTRPSNLSPNHNGRKARIARASIISHPQRRIASIIVTAHAAPKTATNKNSPCASARPQPPPAIRESPISSRKAGSTRGGFISRWFLNGPTRRCHDRSGRAT